MFVSSLFIIDRNRKQPKYPPTNEWTMKTEYIYTMEEYSGVKKNEIMAFSGERIEL